MVLGRGSSYAEALFFPPAGEPTMPLVRSLQPWLTGQGPCLQVAAFVPETPPLRPGADTWPWAQPLSARSPSASPHPPRGDGRPARRGAWWPWRGGNRRWPALTNSAVAAGRPALAVLYACGGREGQGE